MRVEVCTRKIITLRTLLEEYIVSGDINEADKSLRELNVPSVHFQVGRELLR